MIDGKITYHQQVTYCGKPRCRKCREGIGHGPYWYSYQTVNGQTRRKYIGKKLPVAVQEEMEASEFALRVWTLGQFRVEKWNQQWQTVADSAWQQRSLRSLLGYILCSPERKVSRAQVLAVLWPGVDVGEAGLHLNRDIQALRRMLGERLVADNEWIGLTMRESVWVDADAFIERAREDLSNEEQRRREEVGEEPQEKRLREAIGLYNGDFLPEERDTEWAVTRRQQLRRLWVELQLGLADLYVGKGMTREAIDVLDKLLAKDPTNEAAMQRLVVVLFHGGRRSEGLRAYKRFEEVLQMEYKAVPSLETRRIYEAVRQGNEVAYSSIVVATKRDGVVVESEDVVMGENVSGSTKTVGGGVKIRSNETIGRLHQSSLVGRESELELMRGMLSSVEQAARLQLVGSRRGGIPLDTQRLPQCLFLMGDSGIGKTRLAEEMSREAQMRGWAVVWSRLYTQEQNVPYRMWTEALQKLVTMSSGLLSVLSPELLQPLAPLLPPHLEVLPAAIFEKAMPTYAFTPEQEKYRLWDAIGGLLKIISENTPLLIVLDDIQWADGSSHDLLVHLARNLTGYSVMFVATCRDTELPTQPQHPLRKYMMHMQREHTLKTLAVEPLTSEQIGQLVTKFSHVTDDVVKHIQDHAAGNPFFAEELARSQPPTLPKTVKDALGHRMQRLSLECRQLLSHAAVLGGSFELQLICAMEIGGELEDEEVVLELLDEAHDAGVLNDEGTGTRITYHFWHPLLVGYLYEQISALRRARLHNKAAEALLRVVGERKERVAATVANHLEKAGAEAGKIAYYAELAGNNAYVVSAYSEAAYHYQRAVEYLQKTRESVELGRLISLFERLAECTMIRGNYAEARRLCERVLDLRRQHSVEKEESQHEALISALLWIEIAWTWRYTSDNAKAWACCEQSERILRGAGIADGPAWARLFYTQSNLYLLEGRAQEALRSAQQALALFEQHLKQSRPPVQTGKECKTLIQRTLEGDPVNLGRLHRLLGVIAVNMGQLNEALEYQNKALALYEQYNEKRQIAHLSCNIGYIHLKKAEYEQAQAALRRSLNLAEHVNDDPLISLVYSNQGELAVATGDLSEAAELYQRALQLGERFRDREYVSRWNVGLATVWQEQGKLEEAAKCIRRAWLIGREVDNRPCIGMALVALSNLRVQQVLAGVESKKKRAVWLAQAYKNGQRVLSLDRLEVETRIKGKLVMAHIALLQGEVERGNKELRQVIVEAEAAELQQIVEKARGIGG